MYPQLYHTHHSLRARDLPFWESLAAKIGDPILELGCGTGRVLHTLAGLGYTVTGLDYDPDMLAFLGHTQLLVHPAVREGLGVGLLEAQAAGVPVVGFRAGGIPEAVAEGTTGLLVPPGDAEALAAAAVKMLYNPPGRRKMGAAARDWVAAEFNLERMVQGNLDIYRELVDAAVYDR
jgi:glycosyltransferase involved in cell wall biosynthesis